MCILKFVHARLHDRRLRDTQSSQRRLVEGATTASQSAHRDLVPTYPHQVYHLLCSHLRYVALVDHYSSTQPKPGPSSCFEISKNFSSFEIASCYRLRNRALRQRDLEASVLKPSIPAGKCAACRTRRFWCSSLQMAGPWDF